VVALDHRRRAAAGRDTLDDVWIERALGEEVGPVDLGRFLVEDVDEQLADGLALGLRVGNAGQLAEEKITGVNV